MKHTSAFIYEYPFSFASLMRCPSVDPLVRLLQLFFFWSILLWNPPIFAVASFCSDYTSFGAEIHGKAVLSQDCTQWKIIAWGFRNWSVTGREGPFTNTRDLLTFGQEKLAFIFQESKSPLVDWDALKRHFGWWTSGRASCSNMFKKNAVDQKFAVLTNRIISQWVILQVCQVPVYCWTFISQNLVF